MLVCYYSHMVLGNHSRQWHMEYIGTPVPSIFPHTIVMRMLVSYKSALTSKLWSCDDRKGYSPEDHCFSSTSQCPIPISHYTYNFTHACVCRKLNTDVPAGVGASPLDKQLINVTTQNFKTVQGTKTRFPLTTVRYHPLG